ncbi:unnamed protein product, partial [Closterium sp. NIES-53]
ERASAEEAEPPPGTGGTHQLRTEPQPRHYPPPRTLPLRQAEQVADAGGSRSPAPQQKEKERTGQGQEEEEQQPAEGLQDAQANEEQRAPEQPAANCSGSALPSPDVRRATPPATPRAGGPPASLAADTTRLHRAPGGPAIPHCHLGALATGPDACSAGGSSAGAETSRAPAGALENGDGTSGGQATGDETAEQPKPPAVEREETDPRSEEQPPRAGRQWWQTPQATKKQTPAPARRGQHRQVQLERQAQGQDERRSLRQEQMPLAARQEQGEQAERARQAEREEQPSAQTAQPRSRQEDVRIRGEESFQRLLGRAAEQTAAGSPSPREHEVMGEQQLAVEEGGQRMAIRGRPEGL